MSFDLSVIPHKNIVLAVTGGIAAYKSAILVRRLKDYGFDVRVVMTHGAQAFITPLTFQALSGNPVHTELLDPAAEAGMGHIELARWADLLLVAPASCDTLAKFAHGLADDLLSTVFFGNKISCLGCAGYEPTNVGGQSYTTKFTNLGRRWCACDHARCG